MNIACIFITVRLKQTKNWVNIIHTNYKRPVIFISIFPWHSPADLFLTKPLHLYSQHLCKIDFHFLLAGDNLTAGNDGYEIPSPLNSTPRSWLVWCHGIQVREDIKLGLTLGLKRPLSWAKSQHSYQTLIFLLHSIVLFLLKNS